MNAETSLKLFELTQEFIKDKKKAKLFVSKIEETIDKKFEDQTQYLANKSDLAQLETKISNRIYMVGLIQFLAIVGSVLAIVSFMLK